MSINLLNNHQKLTFFADKTQQMIHKIVLIFSLFLVSISCQQGKLLGPESKTDLATESQESCGYIQNEFGERVSWKSNLPVKLYIDSSVPTDMADVITIATQKWEKAASKKLFELQKSAQAISVKPSNDNINSIYWSKTWDDNKQAQQAITTLIFNGPLISEADIKINAKDYEFYTDSPQNSLQISFESIMLHELGHVLGFKHLTIKPTVMWPTLAPAFLRIDLYSNDLKTLKCEY